MKTHNTTMIDGKLIFMIFFKPSVGCQQGVQGGLGGIKVIRSTNIIMFWGEKGGAYLRGVNVLYYQTVPHSPNLDNL